MSEHLYSRSLKGDHWLGEDVNNGWAGRIVTCMDSLAVFEGCSTLLWSCKAISNTCFLDVVRSPELDKEQLGLMDGRTDHCDTLSHIVDHILLTLCSSFQLCHLLFFTALFSSQTLCCSPVSSLVWEQPFLFCYLALKHTGHWDQPVTLCIYTRPRETIGKRTSGRLKKHTEQEGGTGEQSHNLCSRGCFKCSPEKRLISHRTGGCWSTSFPAKMGVRSEKPRMLWRLLKEWGRIRDGGGPRFKPEDSFQCSPPAHSIPREDVRTSRAAIQTQLKEKKQQTQLDPPDKVMTVPQGSSLTDTPQWFQRYSGIN